MVSRVGERALAACETTGGYVCYRSQWGGSDGALRAAFAPWPDRGHLLAQFDWQFAGRNSWRAVVERTDYLRFEAVYRLTGRGVTVYLPLWLGFETGPRTEPSRGVLVRTHSLSDYERLAARLREMKSTLDAEIEAGNISTDTARQTLRITVSDRECHWAGRR